MFQLIQEELGSDQAVIADDLVELPSRHQVRLLTYVLMNRTSDGGLINLQLSSKCPLDFLPSAGLANFGDLIMSDRRQCRLLCETLATSTLVAISYLLILKANDRASFKNETISKWKWTSANETMTARLFISINSLGSDLQL